MASLRRVCVVAPLAAAVMLLAHAVLFGCAHPAGGAAQAGLLGAVAGGLVVLFLGATAVFSAGPSIRRSSGHARYPILGEARLAAALASAGAAGLAALEASEGHGLEVVTSGQVLVVAPVALLIAVLATLARRAAERLGRALASGVEGGFVRVLRLAPARLAPVPVRLAPAARRGRAPPA